MIHRRRFVSTDLVANEGSPAPACPGRIEEEKLMAWKKTAHSQPPTVAASALLGLLAVGCASMRVPLPDPDEFCLPPLHGPAEYKFAER